MPVSSKLSLARVRALCVKETRQIVRDPSSWLIAVVIPCCCCLSLATD
jgi:ABC-2 type transport system permease protein